MMAWSSVSMPWKLFTLAPHQLHVAAVMLRIKRLSQPLMIPIAHAADPSQAVAAWNLLSVHMPAARGSLPSHDKAS